MTWLTQKQVQVNSREEAIAMFKQSNLLDCRLSAYPFPVPEVNGINAQIQLLSIGLGQEELQDGQVIQTSATTNSTKL